MPNEARELREQRDLAQMSQGRAAREVGIDRSTLSMFETGDLQLKPEMIAKLRRIYARELRRRRDELDALIARTKARPEEAAAAVGA